MVVRTARFDMRLSKEQKDLLEKAAAIRGQDLTSFALGVLLDEASEVLSRYEARTLSHRDMNELLKLLEHPPAPKAALKAAFRRLKDFRE